MRTHPRYIPRASIRDFPTPTHPGFVRPILSDQLVMQSTVSPGQRSNVQWITLRPDEQPDDMGLPGGQSIYSKQRPPALILNHNIRWRDTYAPGDWTYVPHPDEVDWRRVQSIRYQTRLDFLEAIVSPTDDEIQEMADLNELVDQLAEGGQGYLETAKILGADAFGIIWGLGVANIPVIVTGTFPTEVNQGQSFRIKRLEAPEGQARHTFTIEMGAGNALYSLVIGEDGNSCEFFHYRNLDERTRKAYYDEIESIKDLGRLTVEDYGDIALWEDQIAQLKIEIKHQGTAAADPEDHALVEELKDRIQSLKDSKRGIPDGPQRRLEELEELLYVGHERFSLQEATKSLLGFPVDFTVQFLRSGYVIIQSRDGRKLYENKNLTGGYPEGTLPRYGDMLPENVNITVRSDGGMWSLVYGNPQYDFSGVVYGQPFEVPFEFAGDEVTWGIEADVNHVGSAVNVSLELFDDGRSSLFPTAKRWRPRIEMRSGGRHTPELYHLEMHIPASEVSMGADIWDSTTDLLRQSSRIVDLEARDDRTRSRVCTLYVATGGSSLPVLLAGKCCTVELYDRWEDSVIPVLQNGYVSVSDQGQVRGLGLFSSKWRVTRSSGSIAKIDVVGCEAFLDREVTCYTIGHNKYVGDYLRELARNAGLPSSMYDNLPVGSEGNCPRIQKIRPGSSPDIKPSQGTRVWDWMREVVKKHAPRWELWSDDTGLRLTKKTGRRRNDISYSSNAGPDSPWQLRKKSVDTGGIVPTQDLREYYTSALAVGGMNPTTGMRFTAMATIPQATDSRFTDSAFYIGHDKPYTLPTDDSLRSEQACLLVAREALNITPLTPQGLPPWYIEIQVDLNVSVMCGDLIRVDSVWYMVDQTQFAPLHDSQKGQQMSLTLRLAEDRRISYA